MASEEEKEEDGGAAMIHQLQRQWKGEDAERVREVVDAVDG
jgi:hypothetical protein